MSKCMKMCVNCKYLKDGKYCNRKKIDIYNPKIFCGYWKQKPNLFDQITASPEVLAVELVTLDYDGWWAYVGIGKRKTYPTREEAIAATVARLKEVCVE